MFQLPIFIIIFLTGLAVGSFLNCIIYRLERGENSLKGRSCCPHCKHILSWQDLIPLLSFLFLKGKCRYCQKKISWQYPLVELATAIIFLIIFHLQFIPILSQFITTLYLFIISGFLIVIFVYDLKHYLIPDKVIYPAIVIALIYNFSSPLLGLDLKTGPLFSAFGASAFFLAIVLFSQGKWMGVGDIKLAFLIGLFLGFPNILVALFLTFFLGAIIGIGLILAGKKTLKSQVPFGPFLVTGTFIALFFGDQIRNWYFNFFNLSV